VPGQCGERGGLGPGSADVGDQDHPSAVAERQDVVGVATDEHPVGAGAVPGRELHPGDDRQVCGQQAALEREGGGVLGLVQPGVVDGEPGAAGDVGGQMQVAGPIAAAVGVLGYQRERGEHPAAGTDRHDHHRSQPQRVVDGGRGRVVRVAVDPALGQLRHEHRPLTGQDVSCVAAAAHVVVAQPPELAQPLLVARVPRGDGEPAGHPAPRHVQYVDGAQVGELRDEAAGQPLARVDDAERGGHLRGGLGEQPQLRAGLLGLRER
jgi:hypothetical protein